MELHQPHRIREECDLRGRTISAPPTQRFFISPRPNRRGVRMDERAIKAAARELGITSDVRVAWSNGTRTWGCHRYDALKRLHRITISTNEMRNGADFSETLWHELQHAADTDRLGWMEFGKQYRMYSRMGYGWSRAYNANPFEKAARERGEDGRFKPLGWNPTPQRVWNSELGEFGPGAPEPRPDWYRVTKAPDPRLVNHPLEELRKARNCLASTKSLLKKAIREENWDRATKLQDKQAKDEARIRDLENLTRVQ